MSAAHEVEALLARLGSSSKLCTAGGDDPSRICRPATSLVLSWPGLKEVLPDGGLPRGVVELAAPRALGGSTSLALAAVRAGQERAGGAWCAWVDPERTLYAPGVVAAGVDLARMLVVCPPRELLGRASVKIVGAGAFEVVVVDYDPISGAAPGVRAEAGRGKRKTWPPEVLVRKLALAAEASGSTVLLLTDATRRRAVPWPVALRLELARPGRGDLSMRVAKDRRGRVGMAKTIPFRPLIRVAG